MRTESPLENRRQDKVVFVVHEVIRRRNFKQTGRTQPDAACEMQSPA
jgi:hypothetical protein